MDDGLQYGSLNKDFTLAVVDARRGVGNARVFPAGPLRAPLDIQMRRVNALLVVGDGDGAASVAADARARGLPVWHGRIAPHPESARAITRPVLAFAGIGVFVLFFVFVLVVGFVVVVLCVFF